MIKQIKLLLPEIKSSPTMYKNRDLRYLKFPCLCTYNLGGETQKGIINWDFINSEDTYVLARVEPMAGMNCISENHSLIALLEAWKIELKEGEIVFYEDNK